MSQLVIEQRVDPVVGSMQAKMAEHDAWAGRLGAVSPTTVLDRLLSEVAGTSARRQAAYRSQVVDFLHQWREEIAPLVFSQTRMTPERVAGLPRFSFVEPTPERGMLTAGLANLALVAALAVWAARTCLVRVRP